MKRVCVNNERERLRVLKKSIQHLQAFLSSDTKLDQEVFGAYLKLCNEYHKRTIQLREEVSPVVP